jgi:hypothetical protein
VNNRRGEPAKRKSRRSTSRQSGRGSQAGSSNWLLLKDAYLRLREYLEPNEAVQRLTAMPAKKRYVNSGRERILPVEEIGLSVGIDATTGADYLEIDDTEYFHPSVVSEPAEFLVPVVNVERELERLESGNNVISDYDPIAEFEREIEGRPRTPPRLPPTTAAPPPAPPSEEPNRTLRRWSAKYEWDAIYAEIARRCIDPETRLVKVPKNESRLAEGVLQWCVDTNRPQPGLTDMRDAVHAICQALRKI